MSTPISTQGTDTSLLADTLSLLEMAVLVRSDGDRFIVEGRPPQWLNDVFGTDLTKLGERSDFLSYFLEEAARYWSSPTPGGLVSGPWTETLGEGTEIALNATALQVADRSVLVIHSNGSEYQEKVELVQSAHDSALSYRQLLKEVQKKEILLECIVHDLNNPLATIIINLQHLAKKVSEPVSKRCVEIALTQANRQATLVHSVMDVFSAEMAALTSFQFDQADAPDLFEAATMMVKAHLNTAMNRSIAICLENAVSGKDGESLRVVGEATHLQRVIENLISNAIRHSPDDANILLRLEDDGDFLILHTIDQGPGVDPYLGDEIFNPFVQGGTAKGASGLGLHFCKITLRRWGGEIGFENLSGGGADFFFRVRKAAAAMQAE